MDITLVVIPGSGARNVTLSEGATLQDVVEQYDLQGRNIIVQGRGVQSSAYSTTYLQDGQEVFATSAVKGA